MTIDDAIASHAAWKVRLRTMLESGRVVASDVETLGSPNHCDLGKWLVEVSPQYVGNEVFSQVCAAHAVFHREAGRVVAQAASGSPREAVALLEGPLWAESSTAVIRALMRLKGRSKVSSPTLGEDG